MITGALTFVLVLVFTVIRIVQKRREELREEIQAIREQSSNY